MKRIFLVTLAAILLFSGLSIAQPYGPGQGEGFMKGMRGGPGMEMRRGMDRDDDGPGAWHRCMADIELTEDQEKSIAKLQRDHQRKMVEMRSELAGHKGKIKLLITDDKFDQKKMNAMVDKISDTKKNLMKSHIEHARKIRDLLTPEQQIVYDRNVMSKGHFGPGGKPGHGRHHKQGKCWAE